MPRERSNQNVHTSTPTTPKNASNRRRARTTRARHRSQGRIFVVSVLGVALAFAFIWISNVQFASPSIAVAADGKSHGDPSAPVVIEVWSDYQCPACGRFALGAGRQLVDTLVADGTVRVVWRDMAFLGDESIWAAEAAAAAAEQGQFWAYHDKLFASQRGENRGAFRKDNLKRLAAEMGLDTAAFNAALDSGRYAAEVQRETALGRAKGVRATPTLFVNDQKIEGVASFEQLQQVVNVAVAKVANQSASS